MPAVCIDSMLVLFTYLSRRYPASIHDAPLLAYIFIYHHVKIPTSNLSKDPSLTTSFFPGRVGMGEGCIYVCVIVVIHSLTVVASFDYSSILRLY